MRSVVDRNVVMQRITCITVLILRLCARWGRGGCSTPLSCHFTPRKESGYPLYRTMCRSAGRSGNFEEYFKNSTAVGN